MADQPRRTQAHTGTLRQTQVVAMDDEAIVDVKAAANFVGYVIRSCKRRRRRLWTTAAITFAVVAAMAAVTPRSYRIESRILTHKSAVMNALVHPDRAIPQSADAPTSGAVELVRSRDNLEKLLADADLIKRWDEKRPLLGRLKDKAMRAVFGPPNENDVHEAYLTMVEEKVAAHVEGDIITLQVEWADAEIAMVLAENLLARLLKMRHHMELSEIVETTKILGRNVESSRVGIEEVVKRMQKVLEDRETDLQAKAGVSRAEAKRRVHKSRFISIRKPVAADKPDPVAGNLQREFAEKNSAFSVMKKAYEDKLRRAEQELANLRASLGPDHPDVLEAKRVLETLSKQPPELSALEDDQARLAGRVGSMPAPPPAPKPLLLPDDQKPHESEEQKFDMMRVPVSEDLYKEMDKDPEIATVLDELKKRQNDHDDLLRRLANARIESETANVAFDFRYIITEPPILPKTPVKPNVPIMVIGGAVAALVLGCLMALLSDIFSGLLLEAWQIERFLGAKLLGEIDEP